MRNGNTCFGMAVTVGGAADRSGQPRRSATAARWSSTTRERESPPVATTSTTTSSERTSRVSSTAGSGPGTSVRILTPVHPDPAQPSTDRTARAPGPASGGGGAATQSGASISAWSRTAAATIGADVAQAYTCRVTSPEAWPAATGSPSAGSRRGAGVPGAVAHSCQGGGGGATGRAPGG